MVRQAVQHYQASVYHRCVFWQAVQHYTVVLALSKEVGVLLHTGTSIRAEVALASLRVIACSKVETRVRTQVVFASS